MDKSSLMLLIATMVATGCAGAGEDPDAGPAQIGGAPQQAQLGTLDDPPVTSTDPRLLDCQLEYEVFQPTFAVKPAASLDTTFGDVQNSGAQAADGAYQLAISINPNPPANLSFTVQIVDQAKGAQIAYSVLPRPIVGGAFLFELGAPIPTVTGTDGTAFDHVRAYCSIRNPPVMPRS
jgi:hypothetical protein